MKLVYQYVVIFFNFLTTSSHPHPLQVENCGSNSRLVVDEDDYGKFRIERVKVFEWLKNGKSITKGSNVENVELTLYKCYTNVLCVLGDGHCTRTI